MFQKFQKMFHEKLCKFLHSKLQIFKLQPLGLHILKITEIPEIASTVKFFFGAVDTNRFFTNNCSNWILKKKQKGVSVFKNDLRSHCLQIFFKINVLKNLAILSGKHLCWSLFSSYQKGTPAEVLYCEYCKIFENSFFIQKLQWLLMKGFIMDFLLEVESGKLYQQLELEYLNWKRWWDVYVYFMVVKYIQEKFFHAPRFNKFVAEQNS